MVQGWRRAVRVVVGTVLAVLALGLPLGMVWLTRHPEAGILARATDWPVVGGWAERFRDAYLPPTPPPAPPVAAGEEPEIIYVDRRGRPIAGSEEPAAEPDLVLGARSVWVPAGTALLAEPETDGPETARTAGIENLRLLDRLGDWFQVRYGETLGWVYLEGYDDGTEPPLGRDPLPPAPLPARAPDPERLAFARELFGTVAVGARIGPYESWSGPLEPGLLPFLDRVVRPLERLYGERYGVVPVGEPDGAIVLFSTRSAFAAYQERQVELHGVRAAGVAAGGVVAVDMEGRRREEIAATLVHELTHLLNRRALGPALPAWLEEGLADDLAQSEIGPDGALDVDRLGGVTLERADGWERRGGVASAIALRRALEEGRLRPLHDLLALDWREFVAPEADQLNYAQASFWVRHLLDDPGRASGFRGFLAGAAAGGSVEPDELRRYLGEDWTTLEQSFELWIGARLREPR